MRKTELKSPSTSQYSSPDYEEQSQEQYSCVRGEQDFIFSGERKNKKQSDSSNTAYPTEKLCKAMISK